MRIGTGSAARSFLAAAVVLLLAGSAAGQEHGSAHGESGHDGESYLTHRHHFGGIIGFSFRLDDSEAKAATTLGLEYARMLTPKWAVAGYVELVSSHLERDIILAAGAIHYPMDRVSLVLAPGVEFVEKEAEHGTAEGETETEAELLLRIGVGYSFPVAPTASVGPTVLLDWAGDRWTMVVALAIAAGF